VEDEFAQQLTDYFGVLQQEAAAQARGAPQPPGLARGA